VYGNGGSRSGTVIQVSVKGIIGKSPKLLAGVCGKAENAFRFPMLLLVGTIHEVDPAIGNRHTRESGRNGLFPHPPKPFLGPRDSQLGSLPGTIAAGAAPSRPILREKR